MKASHFAWAAGVSFLGIAPALAQNASASGRVGAAVAEGYSTGDIIVTARRRDERLQDVPTTINVVTSEELQDFNIRNFNDITSVVAGLSMPSTGVATVRGVNFNISASGTSPTIAFYLNDAPVPSTDLFQAMFDIGQIELLRGPQGTIRGKAAPSGALTLTTRRPSLTEVGGYVTGTGNDLGGINTNGAIGLPIVDGVLAVRVAGLVDHNPGNRVKSLTFGANPRSETEALRGTVLFEPMDELQFIFTAQKYWNRSRSYNQVESLTPQAGFPFIEAKDRNAVQDAPNEARSSNENYNLQAKLSLGGHVLSYVGQRTIEEVQTIERFDIADRFGPASSPTFQRIGQFTPREVKTWSHEVRLSSEERMFGFLDYTAGFFYNEINAPTTLYTPNAVLTAPTPTILVGKSLRLKKDEETSFFGNLTAHLGEATEISGGARYINYKTDAGLCSYPSPQAGGFRFTEPFAGPPFETSEPCALVPTFEFHDKWKTWIYTGSIKHQFSDDLMAYASTGTSWRPGIFPGGFQAANLSERQRSFLILPPEKSTSYELGVKSSFLDKRMQVNLAAFYQKFKNYPYRPSSPVSFVSPGATTVTTRPGFVAPLPVKVYGAELEWTFAATSSWDIGINAAYAHSKSSGGVVPCNDYVAPFGEADAPGLTYTATQILSATDGQGIGACSFNESPAMAPEWSANARTEYRLPVGISNEAFVRGLLSWFGKNDPNDPVNPFDQVKSYALLNLYAGLRDDSGQWEISLYAKNLTNTFRVLSRESGRFTPQFGVVGAAPVIPEYRRVLGVTQPREFGVSIRYAFGSR